MTTQTFYSSGKLFYASYKSGLSRLKGIGFLYLLLSLFFFPGMYFLELSSRKFNREEIQFFGTPQVFTGIPAVVYFPMVIIFLFVMGTTLNSYMHNKKAVDVYHALPIRRETMLLANYCATLTTIAIPMVLSFALVAVGNLTLNIAPTFDIVTCLIQTLCLIAGIASIHTLCNVCTTTSQAATLFALGINWLVPGLLFLQTGVLSVMLKTYVASETPLFYSIFTSPITLIFLPFYKEGVKYSPINPVLFDIMPYLWGIFAIVIVLAACYFYGKRRSELAESRETSGWLYHLILVTFSMGSGCLLAFITNSFVQGDMNKPFLVIGSGIYGALTYFILCGILSRSLRMGKKNLPAFLLSGVLPSALILCAALGWFGYDKYLPALDQIQSVEISYYGQHQNVYKNLPLDPDSPEEEWQFGREMQRINRTTFTQPENIVLVRELHENSVNNDPQYYNNDKISYKLKNGKVVERRYSLGLPSTRDRNDEILNTLDFSKESQAQHNPLFILDASAVENIQFMNSKTSVNNTLNLSPQEIELVYQAMIADTENTDPKNFANQRGLAMGHLSVIYKSTIERVRLIDNQGTLQKEKYTLPPYTNQEFVIFPSSVNTISTLKKLGLGDMLTTELDENLQMVVWDSDDMSTRCTSYSLEYRDYAIIDDPTAIKELASKMYLYGKGYLYDEDSRLGVAIVPKEIPEHSGFSLDNSKAEVPDELVNNDDIVNYIQSNNVPCYYLNANEIPKEIQDMLNSQGVMYTLSVDGVSPTQTMAVSANLN